MTEKEKEFLRNFALTSSAALLLVGCEPDVVYGPAPKNTTIKDSVTVQDSTTQDSSKVKENTQ